MNNKMDKTVFFLGAGFSADAGGPIQNGIIDTILSCDFSSRLSHEVAITKAITSFKDFLTEDLNIPVEAMKEVALEDVFTPIDRCISSGKSFKRHDVKSLVDLRESFHSLMAAAIQFGVEDSSKNKNYVDMFAQHINEIAKKRLENIKLDNIAIVTTNWDILLDNSLNDLVKSFSCREFKENSDRLAVVDYCCYISSLEDDRYIKPGLLALGKSGYNIKYLKLHGSMNWLHCPMCQRMFVKYYEKTISGEPKYCKHCIKNHAIVKSETVKLRGNLLLPTFLKDLTNIQIQLIWQNAGIELAEATKVVFVGYSLPSADFEIRQLLSRCIPKHAEVEVVLYPRGDIAAEKKRYRTFFGNRIKNEESFIEKEVPEYVKDLARNFS